MKKLNIFFAVVLGLLHANVGAMQLLNTTYSFDQARAKKETLCKDGVSFADMEEAIRKKYPNIPDILLINAVSDGMTGTDTEINAAYDAKTQSIWVNRTTADEFNSRAFEWAILHETGHAQIPYAFPSITGAVAASQLLTCYYWGAHKAMPYKNKVTKYGSKFFAAWALSVALNSALMKLEERRADNWANKTADAQALQGGIESLETDKAMQQEKWSEFKLSSMVPFSIAQYFRDSAHPTIDSRIAKCKTALKDRFDIEA